MDPNSLRVKELNDLCKKLHIKTGGRKAEIIERLQGNTEFQKLYAKPRNGRSIPTAGSSSSSHKRAASSSSHEVEQVPHTKKHKSHRQELNPQIDALFDQFQDPENVDCITDDGVLALCDALEIDAQDPVMLVLSWYMEAETMCIYTRSEFHRGLEKLACRSIRDVKRQLPQMRAQLQRRQELTIIYAYSFSFAKEVTQKSLAQDMALGLWEILLPGVFPLLHHWLAFVKANCRNSISKDVWMQVLEFGYQVRPDLSNFDENGAWPVLLDDFVGHMKEEFAANGTEAVLKAEKDGDTIMADAQ